MPNLDNWLGSSQDAFTFDATAIINRDPVSLVLARGATNLSAQTVRVVPRSTGRRGEETIANNTASDHGVVVIGATDLDIAKGDLFVYPVVGGTRYKVIYVDTSIPGHVQAIAEGQQ